MTKFLLLRMFKHDSVWSPVAWADFRDELEREIARRRKWGPDDWHRIVTVQVDTDIMVTLAPLGPAQSDVDPADALLGNLGDAIERAEKVANGTDR